MSTTRLEQQYLKLVNHHGNAPVSTTLEALAGVLFCTRRHVRSLLNQMQAAGWLSWQAEAGRGRHSRLHLLRNEADLRRERAESLARDGRIGDAVQLLGDPQTVLDSLMRAGLGLQARGDRQCLRVPYYRPMPNLYPGTALRRSEVHLVRQIFNGLTRMNEEKEEIEGDLAHHWQTMDDQHWRFFLRPAVRFHDGRLLTSHDVVASLQRCAESPLFAHLTAIAADGPRAITITLSVPDPHLPWLLADNAALILPADHATRSSFASHPVGTGPYAVAENDAWHLRLTAFDAYFGMRALLDEVDIWMWPELGEQITFSQGFGPIHDPSPSAAPPQTIVPMPQPGFVPGSASAEMALEQGAYFLLCDARSRHWKSDAARRWLRETLSPYNLFPDLEPVKRRFWAPAASLLPAWLHTGSDDAQRSPARRPTVAEVPLVLRLAYYEQQPEYALFAEFMARHLEACGIQLHSIRVTYDTWANGDADVDLWLGSVNFTSPMPWSVGAWLLGTPLLRQSISGGDDHQLRAWHDDWRSGRLSDEALTRIVVQSDWLQPLFHHWLHLQSPAHSHGIRLNHLGWFDFKTAWLEP